MAPRVAPPRRTYPGREKRRLLGTIAAGTSGCSADMALTLPGSQLDILTTSGNLMGIIGHGSAGQIRSSKPARTARRATPIRRMCPVLGKALSHGRTAAATSGYLAAADSTPRELLAN